MAKISIVASAALVSLAVLTGCSSDPAKLGGEPEALVGSVVDGPIKFATVCADSDGDGSCANEDSQCTSITDARGDFSLAGGTTNCSGEIIAYGGQDATTGKAFEGKLKAPAGSKSVTPLTTIIQEMVKADTTGATTPEAAQAKLKTTLGITEDVDLTNYNPYSAASKSSSATTAKKLIATQAKVAAIIKTVTAAAAASTSSTDKNAVMASVAAGIAKSIAAGTTSLTDIAKAASEDAGVSATISAAVAAKAVEVGTKAETAVNNETDITKIDAVAGSTLLAAEETASSIETAVANSTDIATTVTVVEPSTKLSEAEAAVAVSEQQAEDPDIIISGISAGTN